MQKNKRLSELEGVTWQYLRCLSLSSPLWLFVYRFSALRFPLGLERSEIPKRSSEKRIAKAKRRKTAGYGGRCRETPATCCLLSLPAVAIRLSLFRSPLSPDRSVKAKECGGDRGQGPHRENVERSGGKHQALVRIFPRLSALVDISWPAVRTLSQ